MDLLSRILAGIERAIDQAMLLTRADALLDRRSAKRALLDRVAQAVGLKRVEAKDEIGDALVGWVDGFYVEVGAGSFTASGLLDRVQIAIDAEGAIPRSVTIGP